MTFDYFNRYENVTMERTDSGILTVRLHTDGGPIVFTGQTHHDLPRALAEIGEDRENKVVILTGTGDVFTDNGWRATGRIGWGVDVVRGQARRARARERGRSFVAPDRRPRLAARPVA